MKDDLMNLVLHHDEIAELDVAERRLALRDLLKDLDRPHDVAESIAELANVIDGYGPLTPLMEDESLTDVLVNGPDEIWVERRGVLERSEVRFETSKDLMASIDRLLGKAGTRADAQCPIADARLADGSRMHVVLPPVAPRGPLVSIRKFRKSAWTLDELLASGMMTDDQAATLGEAVRDQRTIAISGGTGCGKTTLMNAFLGEVGHGERVVLIEETQELQPRCTHHIGLLARGSNLEGVGAVEMIDLVRAALRMRPDRIVVGEVRGSEALAALAALSVGHKGSMVTVHARSAADVIDRLVSLALLASSGATESALRRQVENSFDVYVHLERTNGGRRKVVEICTTT